MRSSFLYRLVFSGFAGALISGSIIAAPVNAAQEAVKEEQVAEVLLGSQGVSWEPRLREKYEFLELTVTAPNGRILSGQFPFGENPVFKLTGNLEEEELNNGREDLGVFVPKPPSPYIDGIWTAEVRVHPLLKEILYNQTSLTQTFTFCVENGKIVPPEEEKE